MPVTILCISSFSAQVKSTANVLSVVASSSILVPKEIGVSRFSANKG